MEVGYINSRNQFPVDEFGPWKHSVEEDLRRVVGDNETALKLSAMADAEKSDYPYMITDMLNEHPRAGMAFSAAEERGSVVAFYDEMVCKE